jgi:hypothetical protein
VLDLRTRKLLVVRHGRGTFVVQRTSTSEG